VFTATVLASLVEEGKVRFDDPVQKFLPASVKIPTWTNRIEIAARATPPKTSIM